MSTTTPPAAQTQIVLPAAVQHLIVPILSAVAVFGGGLPTLFGAVDAAHGNALVIASAYVSYGGIVIGAIVTFWVIPTWLKLVFAVLGLLGTIVSPFLLKGTFDLKTDGPVLLIAVANGLLTAFGQYVRTATATKPSTTQTSLRADLVDEIFSGPTSTELTPSVAGSQIPDAQQPATDDAPKHIAS